MIPRKAPSLPDVRIFNPDIPMILRKRNVDHRILGEDGRVRFNFAMHDQTLVIHPVLQRQRGGDHLAAGTVMIKFPTVERKNLYRQAIHPVVVFCRPIPQCQSEVTVEIIKPQRITSCIRTFPQQLHCTVAQQPQADVHQKEMRMRQILQFTQQRFLKHAVQFTGSLPPGGKDPVSRSQRRIHPKAVADHVRFRDLLQRLVRMNVYVAAHHHRTQRSRRLLHNLLVERQLKRQQILRETLPPGPAKHRHRETDLSRHCIGRQPAALSPRMNQNPFLSRQPFLEPHIRLFLTVTLLQEPGGTAPRSQPPIPWVRGTKQIFPATVVKQGIIFYSIWGK